MRKLRETPRRRCQIGLSVALRLPRVRRVPSIDTQKVSLESRTKMAARPGRRVRSAYHCRAGPRACCPYPYRPYAM
jgi:hypothetical protein